MVKGQGYFSYLLRLWQVGTGQGAAWRASLEEIPTGERRAFAGLDDLVGYLCERMRSGSPPGEGAARADNQPDPGDGAGAPAEKRNSRGPIGLHRDTPCGA